MNLLFDDVQKMIQQGANRFATSELVPERIREIEASPDGFSNEVWNAIVDMGWTGIAVPESFGGSARGVADLCIIAEELGAAAAVTPLIVSAGLAASLLQKVPATAVTTALIKDIVDGSIVTAALVEPTGRSERTFPAIPLLEIDGAYSMSGMKILVPYAASAKEILVNVKMADGAMALVAVSTAGEGVVMSRHKSVGGEPLYEVRFDSVKIPVERVIAQGVAAETALDAGLNFATTLKIAEAVGLCEGVVRLTAEYAKIRKQFGTAIGAYQAVAHPCADMRIQADACRLLNFESAWLLDQSRSDGYTVASTKAYVNEVAAKIGNDGLRLHGAIGYSNEYDLQLYMRRIRSACASYGDSGEELERAAAALSERFGSPDYDGFV